jgi:hypothetical protein
MHKFGNFGGLKSTIVEHPMKDKPVNNNEDNHKVKHCDDPSNPSFPCSSCYWEEIKLSEDK